MTRGLRILARTVLALALLLAALLVLVATFDWNRIKPALNQRVSAELGREFAIEGDLSVIWQREEGEGGWRALLPWPHFVAEKLHLGNPEWAKGGDFVTLERVEFRVAPLPLLWQQLSIPRIDLGSPKANVRRLSDGRNNWTFELPEKPQDGQQQGSSWSLDIGTIGFDKGQVKVDDAQTGTRLDILIDPLGKPIPFSELLPAKGARPAATTAQDYAFGWQAKGSYKSQPLDGKGKAGGLLALQNADLPFPLQAEIRAGDTRIALLGTLTDPRELGALDLRLQLSGKSLAQLYPLTGVTLPETPAYSTDGRLVAQLQEPGGAKFHYQGFNGRIGGSDIHGDLTYVASQPRPKLSGTLTSEQLRFADLGPLIGADSRAGQQARGVTTRQPTDKVLPVEEFRTERWRAMDADVNFTGKRIQHSEKLPFTDLSTHVLLDDGLLSLAPLRFGVAGGDLDSTIRLDGRRMPLTGRAQIKARHFKLKALFPNVQAMRNSLGELNGTADLSGTGNSVAALLGTANGDVQMLVNDGTISRNLMEIAGLNMGNYLVGRLFGDEEVKINCAAADLGLKDGLMTPRLFVFDTENALVRIDGNANFRNERLDLSVNPDSKGVRVFSLRSPLYVRGTFKNPQAGVQTVPLVVRGAGMLALGVAVAPAAALLALVAPAAGGGEGNACQPLLQQMHKR
ncbi:AsmA family protein [Pseudomonas sp. JS3066]|uniref:AsmA family protein n=1 Tax=Pseudomonas sp. JS3066 TaxID=3090665 RepID=UPI002E7BF343|nr:AsmA family protein [Pseudomonas sp. JS3066]WVK92590.1 AsmA family protein [Pseudomonas sp. JS3066]